MKKLTLIDIVLFNSNLRIFIPRKLSLDFIQVSRNSNPRKLIPRKSILECLSWRLVNSHTSILALVVFSISSRV